MKSSVKSFIAAIGTILMVAVSCNKELAETIKELQANIERIQKEVENARLIAQVHFENWARAVKKQFENKK